MLKFRRLLAALTLLAATAGLIGTPAALADWPDRPVSMVIMSKAGGGMDRASRLIGDALAKKLGQPMKYVNRPGASGQIALKTFLGAPADGYTIFSGNIPTLIMSHGMGKQDYKIDDKLAWLGAYLVDPALLVTPSASDYATLEEFIESAKKKPVRVGVANWASVQTLGLLQLKKQTGIQVEIIPYSGFKKAATALLGNHIESAVGNFSATQKLGDGVRYLGIFAEGMPDGSKKTPSIKQALGIEVINAASIRALAVHEKLKTAHPDRYKTLHDAVQAVISDPAFVASLPKIGASKNQAVKWGEAEADKASSEILKLVESFRGEFQKNK